jgi:hypothetical protein
MNPGKSTWISVAGYAAISLSLLLAFLAIASLADGDTAGVVMLGVAAFFAGVTGINLLRSPGRGPNRRE